MPLVDSKEEKRILALSKPNKSTRQVKTYIKPRWRNLVDALGSGPKSCSKRGFGALRRKPFDARLLYPSS